MDTKPHPQIGCWVDFFPSLSLLLASHVFVFHNVRPSIVRGHSKLTRLCVSLPSPFPAPHVS